VKKVLLASAASVFLLAGPAFAADMPMKGPAYKAPPPLAWTWTGFYIGGHAGYGWGNIDSVNVTGNPPLPAGTRSSRDIDGWLGGVQAGYNFQFAPNWLVGIEGDFSWAGIDGDTAAFSVVPPFTATRYSTTHAETDWLATLTGRFGYAMDNWLWYVKGGAAWRHNELNGSTVNPTLAPTAPGYIRATSTGSETQTGWTVGTGLEWGFAQNWSAKVEYNYLNFSGTVSRVATYNPLFPAGVNPLLRDVDVDLHLIKIGINYRFNWLSPAAP